MVTPGGYMFPDLESDITGGAVGIIIPDTVTQTDREIFESLLAEITTAFKTQVLYCTFVRTWLRLVVIILTGGGASRVCRVSGVF